VCVAVKYVTVRLYLSPTRPAAAGRAANTKTRPGAALQKWQNAARPGIMAVPRLFCARRSSFSILNTATGNRVSARQQQRKVGGTSRRMRFSPLRTVWRSSILQLGGGGCGFRKDHSACPGERMIDGVAGVCIPRWSAGDRRAERSSFLARMARVVARFTLIARHLRALRS